MSHLAVMAVGRDRPGIVAAVSGVLTDHGLNIEDSQMTVLGGHFTMMLVVWGSEETDDATLRADLRAAGTAVGLDLIEVHPIESLGSAQPEATHVVTVYGVDHPGIVHAVASALGDRQVNVIDLNTRVVRDEGESPLYVMMLEVEIPEGMRFKALEAALETVAEQEGVDLSINPLEHDRV